VGSIGVILCKRGGLVSHGDMDGRIRATPAQPYLLAGGKLSGRARDLHQVGRTYTAQPLRAGPVLALLGAS
jgi:hypothetical protein